MKFSNYKVRESFPLLRFAEITFQIAFFGQYLNDVTKVCDITFVT